MQQRYWDSLVQYAFALNYYKIRNNQYSRINRYSNVIVALATAGTVTSWSIWKNFSWLLAIVVVVLQIALVAKDFLPYQDRVTEFGKMNAPLETLYLKINKQWDIIQQGLAKESEIMELDNAFSEQWLAIEQGCFQKVNLPISFLMAFRANNITNRALESQLDEETRKQFYANRKGFFALYKDYTGVSLKSVMTTSHAPAKLELIPMPFVKPAKPE